MARKIAAAALLSLGTGVQFGAGWALLAAGALLAVGLPSEADLARVRVTVTGWWQTAVRMPRRALAASNIAAGVVAVPAGLAVAVGTGQALLGLGVVLLTLGGLLAWES